MPKPLPSNFVEYVGKLPPPVLVYGMQKLVFDEDPQFGYRRCVRLWEGYRAEKVARRFAPDLAVYDPFDPKNAEIDFGNRLLRERDHWARFVKERTNKAKEKGSEE